MGIIIKTEKLNKTKMQMHKSLSLGNKFKFVPS